MIRAGDLVPPREFAALRRRLIFDHCKWDPQMEDVAVLAPFPLVIARQTWELLSAAAEALSRETLAVEQELLRRPALHGRLGLPRSVRRALATGNPSPGIARLMRFDFHPTDEGWRLSEVNSDVPGGFIESTAFPELMRPAAGDAAAMASPAPALAAAMRRTLAEGETVALVHATAYTDDRQVMVYLARALEAANLKPVLLAPDQIRWRGGEACIDTAWHRGPAAALFRFFPAEWLPNLERGTQWSHYFAGATTPQCNPAAALLTQSKRLATLWQELETPTPAWQQFLPETREPRAVPRRERHDWVLKPVMGRVGEGVGVPGVTKPKDLAWLERWAWLFPNDWIAQRRFRALPVETPLGPRHVCVGVYVIDGRCAGLYGRLAAEPLINERAQDVAILVEQFHRNREVA